MRLIFFVAMLLPSIAGASDWIELGVTPEVRMMLDKENIETAGGAVQAWVKFIYSREQPGQTVTKGKPFDSSRNQYYVVCSTKKYQVLQLVLYRQDDVVGTFHSQLDLSNLDEAASDSHVTFLLTRICAAANPDAAAEKD